MKYCKECGNVISEHLTFCSRSCATRYNNKLRVINGTCNLLKKNGGSELARKHNKEMMEQGVHPFSKENFSDEVRKLNGEKHSEWVKENQVDKGMHPWQLRSSRINNEYSRELSIYSKSGSEILYLYIAVPSEFPNAIKIGVTRDLDMRSRDLRFPVEDLEVLEKGGFEKICELERQLKLKFSSENTFSKYKSYEIFDSLKSEVVSEVQRLSKSYENRTE